MRAESAESARSGPVTASKPGKNPDTCGKESAIKSVADLSDRIAPSAVTAHGRSLALAPTPTHAPGWLDQLEAAFNSFDDHHETAAALAAASSRARALQAVAGAEPAGERTAALAFAADALVGLMLERGWSAETVSEMATTVARILGASPEATSLELFMRAASNPRLLELPPLLTIELQLGLLLALAPISEISLWTDEPGRPLRCIAHLGGPGLTRRVRTIVRSILEGDARRSGADRNWLHGVPVLRWQQPHAALIGRANPNDSERTDVFLREAARCLASVLEREMLLERSAERERTLAEAGERRLMRLGYDLHDGPLQDLVVLGSDVQQARAEVDRRLPARGRRLVGGRLDDMTAQIGALQESLRELAQSLEPVSLLERPLGETLKREVAKFEARGSTRVTLELGGELEGMTSSQKILIYRIVQEGLSNVREHSGATDVRVTVDGRQGRIEAQLVDNGDGFLVEQTMIRAAKNGRLGLVGLGERVRVLGGRFDLRSKIGDGTTLTVSLPRWRPAESATSGS